MVAADVHAAPSLLVEHPVLMPSQREVWTERAGDWRRHADDGGVDPFYALVNRPAFLAMLPPPGALTVELGAGNGRFTRELVRLGHTVVATDIVEASVRDASDALAVVAD